MKFVERAKLLGAVLGLVFTACGFFAPPALAVLTIEIIGTGAKQIPSPSFRFAPKTGFRRRSPRSSAPTWCAAA
jgi:hypothetical protein